LCLWYPASTRWALTRTSAASDSSSTGAARASNLSSSAFSLSLRLTAGPPEYVPLDEDAGELPRPDVDLADLLAIADAPVVVEVPISAFERHATSRYKVGELWKM
jgi:hypothetical protein